MTSLQLLWKRIIHLPLLPLLVFAVFRVAFIEVADAQSVQESYVDWRDQRKYEVVQIGSQIWMASNLAFAMEESWCYNDSARCDSAGRLYTYEAAVKACRAGWRLPSDEDWIMLEAYLGMPSDQLPATGPRGTDQGTQLLIGGKTGFNAPACGYRRPEDSYVRGNERIAYWLETEANAEDGWHRDLRPETGTIYRSPVTKTYVLSVRCLKEE